MSTNVYKAFLDLIPADPQLVGKVLSHNADGTSTIQFPDGRTLRVQGQDVAVMSNAFVRGGRVQGPAPALEVVMIDV